MHSLVRSPFHRAPAEPEVQFQLPDGAGATVSSGGIEYTADADGRVTVPASVAVEMASHFPPEMPALTVLSPEELRGKIRALDARRDDIAAQQLQPLHAAQRRATEQTSGTAAVMAEAAQQIAAIETKRRQGIADLLLGLVNRRDIDALEKERAAAAARASAADKDRTLTALGADEIQRRISQVHQVLNAIKAERSEAVQSLVRQQAEQAGQAYRAALVAAARALALVQAHALLLQDPRSGAAGSRQSFAPFSGAVLEGLPAFRELEAFKDCPGGVLSIAFGELAAKRAGAQETVDLVAVQQELIAQLSADGVLG